MLSSEKKIIGVVGLGYVGLPLAVEFGKKREVIGFDTNASRIAELNDSIDNTLEVTLEEINASQQLTFTDDLSELSKCHIFIVTVPTPIDIYCQPDLRPLIRASEMIGSILKKNDLVIYESTVYPGATEEVCVPELELHSGLKFNVNFFVGYSP